MMLLDTESNISDIVRSDYRAADVFKKHGINFCCSGQVSLKQACMLRDLDYNDIVNELKSATRNIRLHNTLQFDQWKIDFLVDYIVNVHHVYLREAVPSLKIQLTAFMDGHSRKYPELIRIHELFTELSEVLLAHNRYEEEIIFPYIKQIDSAYKRKETYGNLFVRTLRKPLNNVEKEHHQMGGLLGKIQAVTNDYSFPAHACVSHQVLYFKLKELHEDFLQHSHLEHDILFPKAIEIEQWFLQA